MGDPIEEYYLKYQLLKEETLNSTYYKERIQSIKENARIRKHKKSKIQEDLNHLKEEVMEKYVIKLRPYLEKMFELYDVNNNEHDVVSYHGRGAILDLRRHAKLYANFVPVRENNKQRGHQ